MKKNHPLHHNTAEIQSSQREFSLSRRRFLRALGVTVALPAFESLLPRTATAGAAECSAACASPKRMAFVYFPNGAHQDNWWPKGDGKTFELNKTMQPLETIKNRIQVISGLEHTNATAGPDGAGDHARANATFLTGVRARKTDGSNIQLGISIDQMAAQHIGHLTRFPSLELTCDSVRKSGGCDSGYSCAYQYNLSWRSEATPMTPEPNPRLLFERLFGAGSHGEREKNYQIRQNTQRSILDFVLDDARSLQREMGKRDQLKLDEYLTGVRELEQRIEQTERFGAIPDPEIDTPAGIPADYSEHMRIMYDMLLLAFQTDSTRIATLLLAGDGTNRAFPQIGISEGHHYLSHHQGNEDMLEKIAQIDYYYMQHFARFLEKLEETQDVNGNSLLQNSMIVYGCGNSDGNRHTHHDLPVILAGGGGGTLDTGRYLKVDRTPMSNMFLSMLDRMDINEVDQFGDSTGRMDVI